MQFPLLFMLPSKLTDPLLPSQKLSLFISLLNSLENFRISINVLFFREPIKPSDSLENLPTTINGKSYNDVCLS